MPGTLDHPFEEKAVSDWRKQVVAKLAEQNSIYREVVDEKTVVSSPSSNDFMEKNEYPGYPGFHLLIKPAQDSHMYKTPFLVYGKDTDCLLGELREGWYCCHRLNTKLVRNSKSKLLDNVYAPYYKGASTQEAIDRFIAAGKLKD